MGGVSPVLFREHKATFGPYLRELRVTRGISLRDAAGRLGITFAKLQKMETGGRFRIESPAMFDGLAALYQRTLEEVLGRAGVQIGAPPGNADDTVWCYRRGEGWSRVSDFVWVIEGSDPTTEDYMTAAGYGEADLLYGYDGGITVEVHPAKRGPNSARYEYFAWVNVGERCEHVAVPALPDLIALLKELKPLTDCGVGCAGT